MTVKELREHLAQFAEDLPVYVEGYEYGIQDAPLPRKIRVHVNANDWGTEDAMGGPHDEVNAQAEDYERYIAKYYGNKEPVFIGGVLIPRSAE